MSILTFAGLTAMANHEQYMHRCLQLASLGEGFVAPNPMVGSVLVYRNRIIGEGWHRLYGGAHAEVNCLESVADADKPLIPESTIYVSLEPCAHFGKTPPCANRIVAEGIKKAVVGAIDPFAEVAGRGVSILEQAGVETVVGVLEKECRYQNRRFFTFHNCQRPYIHLKWAKTADGFISGRGGQRLQITGPLANRLVHKWRSEEAAIMVGTKTAETDNPQLNNRYWPGRQPVRVVVDAGLRLPGYLKLFTDGGDTMVLYEDEGGMGLVGRRPNHFSENGPVNLVGVKGLLGHNPAVICRALYSLNIQSVFIEGGAALLNSFLRAGLWDEAHILTGTKVMSGGGVKAPVSPNGAMKEKFYLESDLIEGVINK